MSWAKHQILEKNSIYLLIGILIVVAIGGIVEILPLYWLSSTIEKVQGMRPYYAAGARGPRHLHPRRLLRLSQSDGAQPA